MVAAIEEHLRARIIAYPTIRRATLREAAIDRVVDAVPVSLSIDEAYQHSWARYIRLAGYSNLLIRRTCRIVSAGLRLGLLAGSGEWLRHVDKVRLPYNVNVLTQLVAEEALRHHSLLDGQAAAIKAERTRVYRELERTPGTQPFPSDANFILFRTSAATPIYEGLKRRGVLVRNLHGTHPLLDGCLRTTVGTREENDRLLAALRESLP